MSAYGLPVVIRRNGATCRRLERLSLRQGAQPSFEELTLQKALFDNPQSLPIADIDATFSDLTPLCTELSTNSGSIDIVFASRSGRLVLVETKLWRNPQARREVVAQILDYAAQLTRWRFEDLDDRVSSKSNSPGLLMRLVRQAWPELDEARYVDAMSRSLRSGDFLLIIAGDGIREEAQSLVTLLERAGHARFKLSLVEVAAYRMSEEELLLQPRVLARTQILERSILLVNGDPVELGDSDGTGDGPDVSENETQRARYRAFWSAFLRQMVALDPSFRVLKPANSTNQFFAMPPAGGSCWVSAMVSKSVGKAGVYCAASKSFPMAEQVGSALVEQRDSISKEIGRPVLIQVPGPSGAGWRLSWTGLDFHEGMLDEPDPDWLKAFAELTFRLLQALTPRIKALLRELEVD